MKRRRRKQESGFALLLVFLMAAVLAITLYMEIPRVAFESQRQKEQLLMARGEQYKRAIQLYYRVGRRYPADLDDLERGLKNMRFLRHRYKDPMTGKDEWRLIHIQNGMLTDSVVNKNPTGQKQQDAGGSTGSISAMAGISDLQPQNQGQTPNMAMRRRPSEGGGSTTLGPDGQPIQTPGMQPFPGATPGGPGDQPVAQVGATGIPGQLGAPGQPGDQTATGTPPTGVPGQPPAMPGQNPQFPGMPGAPVSSQTGGVSPQPFGASPYSTASQGQGGSPPYPQPGMQVNPQQANAASGLINNLLTSPRPGGLAGLPGQGQVMGGGLVGVASTADAEGIMVYNDRTNYSEWEFIYDITKDRGVPNPLTGGIGTPASQLAAPINNSIGPTPGAPGMSPSPPQTPGGIPPGR